MNVQTAQSCGNLQTVNECGDVAERPEEIQFICRNTSMVLEIIASGPHRWHRRHSVVPTLSDIYLGVFGTSNHVYLRCSPT